MKVRGDYLILGGRLMRSLERSVVRRLFAGEIVWCFVDLFDEIGHFYKVTWAVMGLLAGEFMRYYCDFRWTTDHILQRIYMGVWENIRKQALRLVLSHSSCIGFGNFQSVILSTLFI